MSSTTALRPMGLLEIIDQTFRLYRQNFWLFFGIVAVLNIPLTLLQVVPLIGGLAALLAVPVNMMITGALTKAISDRYLGDQATFGESYRYIGVRLLPLIGTIIVAYVFVALGLLLLIVGMIVFAFWIAFITQVFVIEDKRYFQAIWRSRFLVGKGVWAELIVLWLILGFLVLLIQGAVGLALGAPLFFMWQDPDAAVPAGVFVVYAVLQSFVMPIALVAMVLLYYDSRIRKEGFDLEQLARQMGKQLPPASPPPPTSQPPSAGPQSPPPGMRDDGQGSA